VRGRQTTSGQRPLRFGLAGTGYWARIAHAPALASTDGIEFTAVWGRNQKAAADLAAAYGVTAHQDVAAFLAGRDVGRVLADAQRQLDARRG